MSDRRIFFGFLGIIVLMMITAAVLIVIPAMAQDEFVPAPRVIKETTTIEPFLLTSGQVQGILSHFDWPCIIVRFRVNEKESAGLDQGIRKAATADKWDVVEAGTGYWRLTRVTSADLGARDSQGSEELRIRHEAASGRVVLAWFRVEKTSLPLSQTDAAEYLKTRFWPGFEKPDEIEF